MDDAIDWRREWPYSYEPLEDDELAALLTCGEIEAAEWFGDEIRLSLPDDRYVYLVGIWFNDSTAGLGAHEWRPKRPGLPWPPPSHR